MKILIVSAEYPPLISTGRLHTLALAEAFLDLGHNVHVLAPKHKGSDLSEIDSRIQHHYTGYFKWMPSNDIGIKWFIPLFIACAYSLRSEQFDRVYVSMPPFFSGVAVWLANFFTRWPLTLIYRDLWSGDPYPAATHRASLRRKIGRVLEPVIIKSVNQIFVISPTMLRDQQEIVGLADNLYLSSTGYSSHKVGAFESSIPMPVDRDLIFTYVGSIDSHMHFDKLIPLINAVASSIKRKINIRHVGRPTEKIVLNPTMTLIAYEAVGEISHSNAIIAMKNADVLLCMATNEPQRLNRKIFEYLAVGKRILLIGSGCSETERIARLVGKTVFLYECHLVHEHGIQMLADKLVDALTCQIPFHSEILTQYEYKNIAKNMLDIRMKV